MELCQGDLHSYVKRKGNFTREVALKFLCQIVCALNYLNSNKIVHRDLKPGNILMTEFSDNATLKIADFGFAKYLESNNMATTMCGTPLYMVCVCMIDVSISLIDLFRHRKFWKVENMM